MQITLLLVDVKPSHGRIDAVPLFSITKIFKSVSGTSPSKGSLYFLNVFFWTTSEIFPDGQLNRNNLSYFARPPVLVGHGGEWNKAGVWVRMDKQQIEVIMIPYQEILYSRLRINSCISYFPLDLCLTLLCFVFCAPPGVTILAASEYRVSRVRCWS